MNLALMSHDRRKELMVQFCIAYCGILSKHTICATNTTGRLVAEASGLPVQLFLSHEHGGSQALIDDLDDVLNILREMMRCDVLDEPFTMEKMIGLTHAELREQSHDPKRFFGVKAMVLPDYTMGKDFALLNQLRTAVRETEVAAAEAFHDGAKYTRGDIIEELNRMSSAMHIMMCRYLAGQYQN